MEIAMTVDHATTVPDAKQDADYVFYELTRSICPDCRRDRARVIARCVTDEISSGRLGYVLVTASKA
jgi:hypothetical protein